MTDAAQPHPGSRRPTGVLLIQLGTPDSAETGDVRSYLREFLSDERVLDMAAPARFALLNGAILPFRPRRSAAAYRLIWTDQGSPLTLHTEALTNKVQQLLGEDHIVVFGMRYKNPKLNEAIDELMAAGCERLVVLPLFPQYASASSGSALQAVFTEIGHRTNVPDVATIGWFYDDPGFVTALADSMRRSLDEFGPDHVLFSYHGLPEKQIRKTDTTGEWCLASDRCCDSVNERNRYCYRAQCFATTRSVAAVLGLGPETYSTTFQSRLAGQKWTEPYTDIELPSLYEAGVRRLAVVTPSFTTDCLETIEEIGIRGRRQWSDIGSDDFLLVPCLNATDAWARVVADLVTAR